MNPFKFDIRSILSVLGLVSVLALGGAVLSPAASAEVPPPPPGAGELPPPPPGTGSPEPQSPAPEAPATETVSEVAPVVDSAATPAVEVRRARITRRGLAVTVDCTANGTIRLARSARQFRCQSGRGSAVLKLTRGQRRRAAVKSGLRVALVVRSAGRSVKVPLVVRGAGGNSATASASDPFWLYSSGACISGAGSRGGLVRVQNNALNNFGIASAGETVYWGTLLYYHMNGAWKTVWYGWESYPVGTNFGYTMEQTFDVNRGLWTAAKVYAWTKRAGYHSRFASFTGGGWGNVYSYGYYCNVY